MWTYWKTDYSQSNIDTVTDDDFTNSHVNAWVVALNNTTYIASYGLKNKKQQHYIWLS